MSGGGPGSWGLDGSKRPGWKMFLSLPPSL